MFVQPALTSAAGDTLEERGYVGIRTHFYSWTEVYRDIRDSEQGERCLVHNLCIQP